MAVVEIKSGKSVMRIHEDTVLRTGEERKQQLEAIERLISHNYYILNEKTDCFSVANQNRQRYVKCSTKDAEGNTDDNM